MRVRAPALIILLLGCGSGDAPDGEGGGDAAACDESDCDDDNECTVDHCDGDACLHTQTADGILCGGDRQQQLHGRCHTGACLWTDWVCHDEGPGALCGVATRGVCVGTMCCTTCIIRGRGCDTRDNAPHLNGAACPRPGSD
jgi:hypothetical protein